MSSEISPSSNPTTPTFGKERKGVDGPAPKAQPEDFGFGEDGMPLNPGDQGVQFIPGQDPNNGEAKVEIGEGHVGAPKFVGLGKEELMKFANDPFWVRLRWILFILFWLIWLAMLAGAVVIILYAPKCSDKLVGPTDGPYYQIYLKSLTTQGSLNEVSANHVDYLEKLGVKSVIISQILDTGSSEGISQVTDFKGVRSSHGTLDDFTHLVERFKKKAIKVILQILPNQSSNKHPWFTNTATKETHYVRKENATSSTWASQYTPDVSGSAWSQAEGSTYLHNFGVEEPDLNYDEPQVVKLMNGVIEHWYNSGADGFLLSDVSFLKENLGKLNDNKATLNNVGNADLIKALLKNDTWNEAGNDTERIRPYALLDVTSMGSDRYAGYYDDHIAIVSPVLAELPVNFTGIQLLKAVEPILQKVTRQPVFWRLGGPRLPRAVDKFGVNRTNLLTMVAATLRGQFILYYGDEYLRTGEPTLNAPVDPLDISREKFAIRQNDAQIDFYTSVLKVASDFNQTGMGGGSTEYQTSDTDAGVFVMKRANDQQTLVVATNFGGTAANVDIASFRGSSKATVLLSTVDSYSVNSIISSDTITLPGASGVILQIVSAD